MSGRRTKHIHEGRYVAEVDVELIEDQTGWSPYLSIEDARKLDDVRAALRQGDLKAASAKARVYELRPVVAR
jgi:hypothetical protein